MRLSNMLKDILSFLRSEPHYVYKYYVYKKHVLPLL